MKSPFSLLNSIKNHLLNEKQKIEKIIVSLRSQDPYSDPDRLIDNAASDTEAKEESSHERFEALEKELNLHKTEIEEALNRIKTGTYGKCIRCKRNIEPERLKIKPTALLCVDCEKLKEK